MEQLIHAILYDDKATVTQLLAAGVDANEIDVYGFTPLIEAAIANNVEIAELLIKHGAKVNEGDVTGRTPLHWAVDNNNMALCELLLKNKANANAYTTSSQTALIYPLLRNQPELKKLLYRYGADLNVAQDFLNAKLIGHRYQLMGQVDIVDHDGRFIELDYEGFFLEFTLSIVHNSLERYRNNFAARRMRSYFNYLGKIINCFAIASELLRYQRYTIDIKQYSHKIDALLDHNIMLIPVAYEGHAVTFIRFGDLLARCDRGANSLKEGSVVIYRISKPHLLSKEFIKNIIYKRQSADFVTEGIVRYLGLETLMTLPLSSQIIGNCSWANVEGAVPTFMFLLMLNEKKRLTQNDITKAKKKALWFYQQWSEWDKDRALEECINGFDEASQARKATKATILGAVLFQQCNYLLPKDLERAEKMLPILTVREYQYILRSYLEIYWKRKPTRAGQNLVQLLDLCGVRV